MPLPTTQKARTEHPANNDNIVASPSDPEAVEQDVARKLRIYGMVQALRHGRLPGNTQLDNALVVLRDMLTRRSAAPQDAEAAGKETATPLSDEGRAVVRDMRDLVEATRQLLRQKNFDEIFQEFIYHTSSIHVSNSSTGVDLPLSIEGARKDGQTAVYHLRTLFRILLTNREVRKLLSDSKLILRDLLAQTAVAAAERVRPSALEMEGLDDAAPARDWVGTMDNEEGGGQSPSEQGGITPENSKVEKESAKDTKPGSPVSDKKTPNGDTQKTNLPMNLKDRFWALVNRVPTKSRVRAEQEYKGAITYLKEEFPQERRDQFVWRLKKVVKECQTTPSYQASISWLLGLFRAYLSTTGALATSHAAQTNDLFAGDPTLARAMSEMRTIAERGAGGQSLSGVLEALEVLWGDARADEEMREWWEAVDAFVNKTMLQPGYLTSSQFTSQSRKLHASGCFFFTQKYKTHTDTLVDAVQSWSRAWLDDPLHVRFADDWSKFVRDLLFDERGGLIFKSPLWKDMRAVILPGMLRKIGVIPIPRIEYVDDDLDLVIENLTLQGTNLFPKTIEVEAQHYSKLSPFASGKRKAKDEHRTEVTLTLSGIQADMHDVAFDYHRKSGIVLGIGKVKLTNAGLDAENQEAKGAAKSVFEVKDVSVKVEGLKFVIRESNHDFLYRALRPLATRLIKRQVTKVFSDGIRTSLVYVDEQLGAARAGMAKAKSSEDGSKRKLFKQLWTEQTTRVSSKRRKSSFRVVPKRESILLPDQGHKKGWIRRKAEKDAEASAEGVGWRSEAFNMHSHYGGKVTS